MPRTTKLDAVKLSLYDDVSAYVEDDAYEALNILLLLYGPHTLEAVTKDAVNDQLDVP